MSYKIFKAQETGGRGKATISIKNNGLLFSKKTTRMYFDKVDFVELYFDEDNNRIALKPLAEKTDNSCKLSGNQHKRVTSKDFIEQSKCVHLAGEKFEPVWNDSLGMLEIQL